ncbi:MAG: SBBP repeat-containing protein [Komarekiella atlantica HA4396-MV6]|nr:SBBP repeat-containing protein [Komarekiella atlantica HA4396-MV6]
MIKSVDKHGNAYVVGSTGSQDFPTKNAFDNTYGGNSDVLCYQNYQDSL